MTESSGPRRERWLVLGVVMMGTFMAILDASIVNVALPHMMSAFGVTRDQIEWVATAFMLATAVAMPLVGFLAKRLGHKLLYLSSLSLFVVGSLMCAAAWSYHVMIVARVVQAIGGGAIQPVGMAIVADLFEPEERGRALGVWGTGIMLGPALGPTLGGYLTDWFNWRVIFSVNLPFGLLTLALGLAVMRGTRGRHGAAVPFDLRGFITLSTALIAGLLALSNGQEKGWTSTYIVTCAAVAVAGLVLFVATEATVAHPLLDLRLFRYRNFSVSMALAIFRAVGLFGGVFLLPIFLERLVGYTTIQTGLWMMPGAVAVGIMMPVAGRLADRYSPVGLVVAGTVITSASLFVYGNLDPRAGAMLIIAPQVVRGAGLALLMAPLMAAAINAVPRDQVATASSFLNVAQRVGGAFGIAVLNTFVTRSVQTHAVELGQQMPTASAAFSHLAARAAAVSLHGGTAVLDSPGHVAMLAAARAAMQRATVLAFDNGFVLAAFILLLATPLALLLEPGVARRRR